MRGELIFETFWVHFEFRVLICKGKRERDRKKDMEKEREGGEGMEEIETNMVTVE